MRSNRGKRAATWGADKCSGGDSGEVRIGTTHLNYAYLMCVCLSVYAYLSYKFLVVEKPTCLSMQVQTYLCSQNSIV